MMKMQFRASVLLFAALMVLGECVFWVVLLEKRQFVAHSRVLFG